MKTLSSTPTEPSPETLRSQLAALPPRSANVLCLRLLDGFGTAELAAHYGITPEAARVLFLRAALELVRSQGLVAEPPRRAAADEEHALAARLDRELEQERGGEIGSELALALLPLRRQASAVKEAFTRAEREADLAPARRQERIVRRALVALILAVSLWLYVLS